MWALVNGLPCLGSLYSVVLPPPRAASSSVGLCIRPCSGRDGGPQGEFAWVPAWKWPNHLHHFPRPRTQVSSGRIFRERGGRFDKPQGSLCHRNDLFPTIISSALSLHPLRRHPADSLSLFLCTMLDTTSLTFLEYSTPPRLYLLDQGQPLPPDADDPPAKPALPFPKWFPTLP